MRSAGVTPEVNFREHVTRTPLPITNKAVHSGFETLKRCHQKSKTVVSVAQQKRLYVLQKSKKKFKKGYITFNCLTCAASGRDGSGTVYRGVSEVPGLTGVRITDGAG